MKNITFKNITDRIENMSNKEILRYFINNYENNYESEVLLKQATRPFIATLITVYSLWFQSMDEMYSKNEITDEEFEVVKEKIDEIVEMCYKSIDEKLLKEYEIKKLLTI